VAQRETLEWSGGGAPAEASRIACGLRRQVRDPAELLAALERLAARPGQGDEVVALLRSVERQLANFQGRPTLRLTAADEPWLGAHDSSDARLPDAGTRSGSPAADEEGRYLARTVGPDAATAITSRADETDAVEEQVVPARSIVLEGPASPQSDAGAWARGGQARTGGVQLLFHAGRLSARGVSTRVERRVVDSEALDPTGRRRAGTGPARGGYSNA
jgi:hypothetical protein